MSNSRQMKYFWIWASFLLLAGGITDQPDLSRYTKTSVDNVEEARDIEDIYTDSSYLLLALKAPLLRRTYSRFAVIEEFSEGLNVTFYDKTGIPRSWLKGDYGVRDQTNRRVTVQQNVLLYNDAGERIEGPELIWDERNKEIYTDRFVKITRADGSVIYSYGFKSNERFTRYELNAISGDMGVEEIR